MKATVTDVSATDDGTFIITLWSDSAAAARAFGAAVALEVELVMPPEPVVLQPKDEGE